MIFDLALCRYNKFSRIVGRERAKATKVNFFVVGGQEIQAKLDGVTLRIGDPGYLDLNEFTSGSEFVLGSYFLRHRWSA